MQGTPDVSSGLQVAARNVAQVGEAFDQIAQRDASEQAFSTHAKLQQDWLTFDADARQRYRGRTPTSTRPRLTNGGPTHRASTGTA